VKVQSRRASNGAFVPLKFALGKALQFHWSTEYAFVGGLRRKTGVTIQWKSTDWGCSVSPGRALATILENG
jgi:hypothetical protein